MAEKQDLQYIVIGQGQEWCNYSWKGYRCKEDVTFYNGFYTIIKDTFLRKIIKKHFGTIKRYKKSLPLKWIWYPYIFKSLKMTDDSKKYVVILYDWGPLAKDMNFVGYLRCKLPDVTLVYLFSNIVRISSARKYGYLDKLKTHFDQIYAFDKEDAANYGFDFSPLIYTRDPEYKEKEKEYDVFYVGNAKDRLDSLHEIYEKCRMTGLRCCFFINGVAADKKKYADIHYNEPLGYGEVLDYIAKSKCMVDAIQGGSTAMTIKVCESVIYDKKLITTNRNVVDEPYYSAERFYVYPSADDIKEFVNKEVERFSEKDREYYSPTLLFEKIKKKTK